MKTSLSLFDYISVYIYINSFPDKENYATANAKNKFLLRTFEFGCLVLYIRV